MPTSALAKNCRTSVEMIEKYNAAHIKTRLHASAINVMSATKTQETEREREASPKTQVPQQPEDHETAV